jgi:hypothetical protein
MTRRYSGSYSKACRGCIPESSARECIITEAQTLLGHPGKGQDHPAEPERVLGRAIDRRTPVTHSVPLNLCPVIFQRDSEGRRGRGSDRCKPRGQVQFLNSGFPLGWRRHFAGMRHKWDFPVHASFRMDNMMKNEPVVFILHLDRNVFPY